MLISGQWFSALGSLENTSAYPPHAKGARVLVGLALGTPKSSPEDRSSQDVERELSPHCIFAFYCPCVRSRQGGVGRWCWGCCLVAFPPQRVAVSRICLQGKKWEALKSSFIAHRFIKHLCVPGTVIKIEKISCLKETLVK